MNKQEAIDKLRKESWEYYDSTAPVIETKTVIEIINQIDEPQKPKVPQFVANWYEEYKDYFEYNLHSLCVDFHERKLQEDLHEWFNYLSNKPIETLVKMKLLGYEVEKEKLYTVELPNPDCPDKGKFVLCKNKSGKVFIKWTCLDDWKFLEKFQLTEVEIKKDFAWAWEFKEEVK